MLHKKHGKGGVFLEDLYDDFITVDAVEWIFNH